MHRLPPWPSSSNSVCWPPCVPLCAGIIDLRYVAVLPYNLSQQAQPPSGASRASGTSGASSDSDDEEGRLERRDSVARGPEAQAYGAPWGSLVSALCASRWQGLVPCFCGWFSEGGSSMLDCNRCWLSTGPHQRPLAGLPTLVRCSAQQEAPRPGALTLAPRHGGPSAGSGAARAELRPVSLGLACLLARGIGWLAAFCRQADRWASQASKPA